MRVVREATLAQRILVEDISITYSNDEEEITMAIVPLPPTMGDYCKRTDKGFVPANPANFDITNYVLSGLRDNPFKGNAIRDPWEHLAHFYEATSTCRPTKVIEDQVKLRFFGFSLIGRAKDWFLCISNGTTRTWKELEDKFLKIFFTAT